MPHPQVQNWSDLSALLGLDLSAIGPTFDVGGAAGNGNADEDLANIQATIDKAVLAGGGIVQLRDRTYLPPSTLNVFGDNITLRGVGPQTQIKMNPGVVSASIRHMVYVKGNNFLCENLTFDQQQSTQTATNFSEIIQLGEENASGSAGVSAGVRYSNLRVRGCRFLNGVSGHIRAFKCQNIWILDNYCSGLTTNTGITVSNVKLGWVFDAVVRGDYCDFGTQRVAGNNIFVSHSGNSVSGSERVIVIGNEAVNCGDSPIEASSSTSGSGLGAIVQNVILANNLVRLGSGLVSLQSRGVQIANNTVLAPGSGGSNASGIRVGCSSGASTAAIQENVLVQGNLVLGDANTTRGLTALSSGGIMRRLNIVGNHLVDITGTGGLGIQVDGASVASPNHTTDVKVMDNHVLNCTTALYSFTNLDATALLILDGSGAGVPAFAASQESTRRRTDAVAAGSLYVKETAASSTAWVGK